MAVTESTYTGNGSTTNYSFTFPYLKTSDIKTSINGTATTAFTLANATTVQFNTAPANSAAIRIYRATDDSDLQATFYAGSAIKSSDLNDNFNQTLYVTQESNNKIDAAWTTGDETITSSETWVSNDTRVSTTAAQDARIDSKIDTALTTDVAAGNKITVTDNSPGSGQITVGVTSGSLVDSDINASAAIAGTKVTPNFGSQNIVTSGTVDGRDVSTDGSKLDGIETGATADQTNAEIRAAVEAASDSNVFTDTDHTKLNAIEANATADQTAAEIRTLVESATDSNVFTDADHTKVNNAATLSDTQTLTNKTLTSPVINDMSGTAVVTSGTSTSDNKTYSAKRAGEIFYGKGTVEEIQSGETWTASDDKVATTSAIDARIIDLVDDVGGFVPIANETSFPNANPDVNNGAGTLVSIKTLGSNLVSNGSGVATIANGTVGNSTVTINGLANSTTYAATFGMIVETTTTLNTYTFHRLVPKATEVTTVSGSISNVNSVAGSISNVNSVAGNATNINTVAGSNSNVTSVAGSISNVNSVASNLGTVNDFAARYRTGSSNPTSSLDAGDLFFNTTANELKVYNGSAWQGGVTATGNFAAVTGNTFTGDSLYNDGVKVKLGTGSDLQIYHDASNSYIANTTGNLIVKDTTGTIYLQSTRIDFESEDGEQIAHFISDGAVELYYDNSKKLETTSTGVTFSGHVNLSGSDTGFSNQSQPILYRSGSSSGSYPFDNFGHLVFQARNDGSNRDIIFATGASASMKVNRFTSDGNLDLYGDNQKLRLGAGNDLEIYHDGSHSYITNSTGYLHINSATVELKNAANNETTLKATQNAAVELFYDNVRKFRTTAEGAMVYGSFYLADSEHLILNDTNKAKFGNDGDLEIYHDGTHSRIDDTGTGSLVLRTSNFLVEKYGGDYMINGVSDGAVELYYDGSKKFETANSGLSGADNCRVMLGSGADLQLWHDGTNSIIDNTLGTGTFYIRGDALALTSSQSTPENYLVANANGAVELYYDNSKKLSTTANGTFLQNAQNSAVAVLSGSDSSRGLKISTANQTSPGTMADASVIYDAQTLVSGTLYGEHQFQTGGTTRVTINRFGNLQLPDDGKIQLGTSQDLEIYHNGSTGNSNIKQVTGDLYFYTGSDLSIHMKANGAVDLYYDNAKKLDTRSWGVQIEGGLILNTDHEKLYLGAGNDLQIWHDGTYNTIKSTNGELHFKDTDDGYWIRNEVNGAVSIYYDGSKKLETTSDGIKITAGEGEEANLTFFADEGDNATDKYRFRTADSGGFFLENYANGSSWETNIKSTGNGNVELYYDNSKKFETVSAGAKVSGHLLVERDSTVAKFDVTTSGDVDGIQMRHARGGLSGYIGKMISFQGNDGTEEGNIKIGTTTTQYNTSSDYRLKQNTVTLSNGITRLKQLKPYNFEFKKDPGVIVDGFFAHEVQEVVAQAASGDKDAVKADGSIDPQSIDHSKLVPLLTAALQEAITKIETLETKVAALESS